MTLDINVVHEMFVHPESQVLSAIAAKNGFRTKIELHACSNCAISKAKQKSLHKLTAHKSTNWEGELLLIVPVSRTPVVEELIFGF
jgi:hypothetical protein